jgi:glycosyltransferase involved in cell wall biosynthesis
VAEEASIAVSLIVASRNGEEKLGGFFESLDADRVNAAQAELILIDSASTDSTGAMMRDFAGATSFPVRAIRLDTPGLGRAQNAAAELARGAVLAFTDDDCRLASNYFAVLGRDFDAEIHHYGGGYVELANPDEDRYMANTANWFFDRPTLIPPRSLLPAGVIHGANLIVRRDVFRRLGGFDPDLGPGAIMGGGDVELLGRASALGYTGLLLPALKVIHCPGRPRDSLEARAVVAGYDRGRGVYYASLLLLGESRAWQLWRDGQWRSIEDPEAIAQLEREFRGAADYLRHRMETPIRPGAGPED